ncbi:hypothetical protein AURDEDRAFT_168601 [Auricularia subglabra TFB-10046 SS5]|nr:hypothetical protein AURDEDRAFT_168601 [Auricularia subglabra TFB-10046 SS5]
MDDNRAATALEARAIRAYLDTVTEPRERQVHDAQSQLDSAATQVDAAALRMDEALLLYVRMKSIAELVYWKKTRSLSCSWLAGLCLTTHTSDASIFAETMASTVENGTFRAIQVLPYRLAAVCRSWRVPALNTKAIWRKIRVDFGDFDQGSQLLVGLYQLYLDLSSFRAGKSGIELFISRTRGDITPLAYASSGNYCVELIPHLSCLIACRSVRLLSVDLPLGLKNFDILAQSAAGLEELRLIDTHLDTLSLPPQHVRKVTIHPRACRALFVHNSHGDARLGFATVFAVFPNADTFSIDLDCEQLAVANQLGHARAARLPAARASSSCRASRACSCVRSPACHRRLVLDVEIELEAVVGAALRNGLPHLAALSCPRGVATSSFLAAFAKGALQPCPTVCLQSP